MSEDFVEKALGQCQVKVNLKKMTFQIFQGSEQIANPASLGRSTIHELITFVFVGEDFQLMGVHNGEVGVFPVKKGVLLMPFKNTAMSDIRHAAMRVPLDVEAYPVLVYQFEKARIEKNLLPRDKLICFILGSHIGREVMMRLRVDFPLARFAIFRIGKNVAIETMITGAPVAASPEVRATDLPSEMQASLQTENPVFAARLHLRAMDFPKMWELPTRMKIESQDGRSIIEFLNIMISKSETIAELKKNADVLVDLQLFYTGIVLALDLQVDTLESTWIPSIQSRVVLNGLEAGYQGQIRLRPGENGSDVNVSLDVALGYIEDRLKVQP